MMDGLLQTVESVALRIAPLTAGIIVGDRTGIKDMIMSGVNDSDLMEAVRYTGYLVGVEMASDWALENTVGIRAPSLHQDVGAGFLTSFGTNVAVYYLMEKTDLLEKFLEPFEGSDERRAVGTATVYALAQEISYRIISMWFNPKDPSQYGNKWNN